MKTFKLIGHNGRANATLTIIDESRFRFQSANDFCRYGGFSDEDAAAGKSGCSFVDPSGGPFVAVGTKLNWYHSKLPDKEIVKIENDGEGTTIYI